MNMNDLDARHLEIFAHVVEAGGMTQAGKRIGLSQPTVSGHIHSLEEAIGARLLHRGGGRAKPTAAGELVFRHAKKIIDAKQAATDELLEHLGLRKGEIRIGASTTPATYYLPPLLARFAREHDKVAIHLEVGDTAAMLALLDEDKVEIALVGDEVDAGRYHVTKLGTDRIVLAVGRGHALFERKRVVPRDLLGMALIARGKGSATLGSAESVLETHGLTIGRELPIVLRLPTNEAIREAVAHGAGAAFLPECCLAGRGNDLKALEINGLAIERPFSAVLSLGREASPAVKMLLSMLT